MQLLISRSIPHIMGHDISVERSEAQNGYAARRMTGPIINRAVSRSDGVLRSSDGF
jgi:hypothetical protein